jgi:hypothetical protein
MCIMLKISSYFTRRPASAASLLPTHAPAQPQGGHTRASSVAQPWYQTLRQATALCRAGAQLPPRPVKAHFVATRIDRQLQVDVSVAHRLSIARAGITGAACGALVGLIVGAFAMPPLAAALGGVAVGALAGAGLFCLVGYCAATGLTLGWHTLQHQRTQGRVHRHMDGLARALENSSVGKLDDFIDKFRTDATREEFADTLALRDLYKRFLNELEVEKKSIIETQAEARAKATQDSEALARRAATEAFSLCISLPTSWDKNAVSSELWACARYFPYGSKCADELNFLASECESIYEAHKIIALCEKRLTIKNDINDRSAAISAVDQALASLPQLERTNAGPNLLSKYVTHLKDFSTSSRFKTPAMLPAPPTSNLKPNSPPSRRLLE